MAKSLSQSVLDNSAILAALKVAEKGLGLVSTLILARLLTPEDFGIVAVIMIFVIFFETIGNSGAGQYLIQKPKIDDEDINTAFTLNLIIKGILFFLLILATPFIVDFYENEELKYPLYFTSLIILIRILSNPGVVLLKKNLNFKLIAKTQLYTKLITFCLVLLLAYIYGNYWALIVTNIVSVILLVLFSYRIHPYRPSLTLKKVREQLNFSQWIILRSILGYTRSQVDRIFISKIYGLSILGEFHISKHLASIPGDEIIKPAAEPLFSSFSLVNQSDKQLNYQFRLSMVIMGCVSIPISAFLFFNSNWVVPLLLGDQWINAIDILAYLSLMIPTGLAAFLMAQVLIAKGKPSILLFFDFFSLAALTAILLSITHWMISDFVLLRSVLSVILNLPLLFYIAHKLSFNPFTLILELTAISLISVAAGSSNTLFISSELNTFLIALLSTSSFIFIYLILLLMFHFLYYRKTEKGMHIEFIVKDNLKSVGRKFRK